MVTPILAPSTTWFTQGGTTVKRSAITQIDIKNSYTPVGTITSSWDASAVKDGSIMCYVEGTKLTIAGNGSNNIKLSPDATCTFSDVNATADYFSNLETINGLELLDTSNVTTMQAMFSRASKLIAANVENWNISNVTSLRAMFQGCSSIQSLDLSRWDVSNVTTMYAMFLNQTLAFNFTTIGNVSNWNTSKCTDLTGMFQYCGNLESLDLSNWDTSKVTTMQNTFFNCTNLKTLNISNWNTSSCTNMSNMFKNDVNLKRIVVGENFSFNGDGTTTKIAVLPTPNPDYITGANGNWYRVSDRAEFTPSNIPNGQAATYVAIKPYPILAPSTTWFTQGGTTVKRNSITQIDIKSSYTPSETVSSSWDASATQDNSVMCYVEGTKLTIAGDNTGGVRLNSDASRTFSDDNTTADYFSNLETITGAELLDTSDVTTMQAMFSRAVKLKNINVNNWNTSNVTSLRAMFQVCSSLESLDLSNWDVSNVTTMYGMFMSNSTFGNMKLVSIGDVSNWNTSKCTDMAGMFQCCENLESLDLSNWNNREVTTIEKMFHSCTNLKTLKLDNWDMSFCTKMNAVFYNCTSLISLNLNNWNTSSCTNMSSMFSGCTNLTVLDVSNWNTSSCTNMSYMFNECTNLTELDVSNWNTSSCTNMSYMFRGCVKLEALDVSQWDVSKVTVMTDMFSCGNNYGVTPMILKELDVSNWNTSSCTDMSFMFYGCVGPKVIDVSKWDVSKVTTFDHMFSHSYLKIGNVANWTTPSAINMNAMFYSVRDDVIDVSKLNTSNVTIFDQMFEECNATKIIGLENFNTSNGLGFSEMFGGCHRIKELNLKNFDTTKAKDGVVASGNNSTTTGMSGMFSNMNRLEKITVSENFSFNGDGTSVFTKAILPSPNINYISEADGNWYTFNGTSYTPSDIPNKTANTYYASISMVKDIDVLAKNGTFIEIAGAIKEKTGTSDIMIPSQMPEAIYSISSESYDVGYNNGYEDGQSIEREMTDALLSNINIGDYYNDSVTKLRTYAFYYCSDITSAEFPNVTECNTGSLRQCANLTRVKFSKLGNIYVSGLMADCPKLEFVDLGITGSVGTTTFSNDSSLKTIILRKTTVAALQNLNSFNNTPYAQGGTGGKVFVPSALIESYKTASNWSTLYGYGTVEFVALEGSEYE